MNAIQAPAAERSVQLASIIRAQYAGGKIALPLNGGVYASFKHVQGVPSSSPGAGYSLNKLQMIDVMIDRLVRLRGGPRSVPQPASDTEADATVESLSRELAKTIDRASVPNGSFAAGLVERGMLVSLVA